MSPPAQVKKWWSFQFNILIEILSGANFKLSFWKINIYPSNSNNSRKEASNQRSIWNLVWDKFLPPRKISIFVLLTECQNRRPSYWRQAVLTNPSQVHVLKSKGNICWFSLCCLYPLGDWQSNAAWRSTNLPEPFTRRKLWLEIFFFSFLFVCSTHYLHEFWWCYNGQLNFCSICRRM